MDISFSPNARFFAGIIALVASVGLAVQFDASSAHAGPPLATMWSMLRYFTILTNLALAITFTGVALGRPGFGSPSILGGVTLAILLVGVIFSLLLSGAANPVGIGRISNFLMHYVTPILTPLFWLAFAPKGVLRRHDPLIWAIFPLGYLAYALLRGRIEGHYPYSFMDVALIGWGRTGINAAFISVGFMAVAYMVIWLDGRLAKPDDRARLDMEAERYGHSPR
jgi:hypothetical protein